MVDPDEVLVVVPDEGDASGGPFRWDQASLEISSWGPRLIFLSAWSTFSVE